MCYKDPKFPLVIGSSEKILPGMSERGMPERGMPERGMPERGMPERGMRRRGSSLNYDLFKSCQKEKPRHFMLETPKFF